MINIFTTLDDAYYPRLKVFCKSLKKHNKSPIVLTITYYNLSEKNLRDFERFSQKIGLEYRLYKMERERTERLKLIHHIVSEAYNKLFVLDVYPDEERALWIDVDTVVLGDISEFYNCDMGDYYVSGVAETKGALDKIRLGLEESGCYINAGVILFNLTQIRKDFITEDFFALYQNNEDKIRFADQDIVNLAFAKNTKNEKTGLYNYLIRSETKLSLKEVAKLRKEAKIIHFIRHIKPWHYYYQGNARFIYLKEMFPIYPLTSIYLFLAGELYKFKRNKKTLSNSNK